MPSEHEDWLGDRRRPSLTVSGDAPAVTVQDVPHGEIRTLRRVGARRPVCLAPYEEARNGASRLYRRFATHSWQSAGRTTFSTTCSRNGRSSRSWWCCRSATEARTSTATAPASRRKARDLRRRCRAVRARSARGHHPDDRQEYRTAADRRRRAIVGFSMGGGAGWPFRASRTSTRSVRSAS